MGQNNLENVHEIDSGQTDNKLEQRKNEIAGILIMAWGFLSVFAVFTTTTGVVGQFLSDSYKYVTGMGGYLIPLLLILWGGSLVRNKGLKLNLRLFGFLLTYIIVLALIHTYMFFEFPLRYAMLGKGGGIIGGGICYGLTRFFGKSGTYIILYAFLLIGGLLWFDIHLKTIFHRLESYIKGIFSKNQNENDVETDNIKELSPVNEIAVVDENDDTTTDESIEENQSEKDNQTENEEYYDVYEESEGDSEEEYDSEYQEIDNDEVKEENETDNSEDIKLDKDSDIQNIDQFKLPGLNLLQKSGRRKVKLNNKTELLEETLASFGVDARVIDVNHGPTITRYEVQPASGVKVSKIVNLSNDIALALAAPDVRIEAPIPGKAAVGIEVPHSGNIMVRLRDILSSKNFKTANSKLPLALGKGIDGKPIVTDLSKMPHLLIAGATGSGKSVCVNTLIASLIYKATPQDLKLILVDPKKVELSIYKGLPHLFTPVVTDPQKAANVLKLVVNEMENRYDLFQESGTRGIKSYNKKVDPEEKLPYIVVIIDELSDLMMVAANEVEDNICRLAQMSRAAGIHLIIATQRPSVDVITGLIKANIPSRISFAVSSQTDSRTILDMGGAEKLLGKGDMLFAPVDANKPKRIQGALVEDNEIKEIVDFVKNQADPDYEVEQDDIKQVEIADDKEKDDLYEEAVKLVVNYRASISMLQRRLHIGHSRAARMIDTMEEEGIVGPYAGSKPREVLITEDELDKYLGDETEEESCEEEDESNSENDNKAEDKAESQD